MLHIVCLLALTFMKVEWLKEATFNLDRAYHFSDNLKSNLVAKNWWFSKIVTIFFALPSKKIPL